MVAIGVVPFQLARALDEVGRDHDGAFTHPVILTQPGSRDRNGLLWMKKLIKDSGAHWPESPLYGGAFFGVTRFMDDVNRHYYRIHAGHNTVIVNGVSKGAAEGSWGSDGMLMMDTTRLEAMEPEPLHPALTNTLSFSRQRLADTINNCTQQWIVSVIRTSDTSGYYFDLLRSKSNDADKFHDYIYHNIGDDLVLMKRGNEVLTLTSREHRYRSRELGPKPGSGGAYTISHHGRPGVVERGVTKVLK